MDLVQQAETAHPPIQGEWPFTSERSRKTLLALVLVAGTLWLYKPVEKYGFINFDDPDYVTSNIPVQHGLEWRSIHWAFTTTQAANWHPLTWLSHMLDVELYGMHAAGHHLTSVLLHAINVLLLFLILQRVTGYLARSFIVAAMFAAHPLNVQSVAWIAERKNVLSTTFLLLTVIAYGWYALAPSWRRYLAVCAGLALGLMAKAMLVSVPFLLLLLDYWPLFRWRVKNEPENAAVVGSPFWPARSAVPLRKLVLEKIPLLGLCAGSAAITVIAQQIGAHGVDLHVPWRYRPGNALYSYAWYLQKLVWPTKLAIYYPHPLNTLSAWQLWVAAGVLLAESLSAALNVRKKPYAIVAWLWYLIALVPVIGIVQVGPQARADRYAYVPMIGILVTAVWAICEAVPRRWWRVLMIACGMTIVALGVDTRIQLGFWRDSVTLFTRDLEIAPENNYLAHASLANALLTENRCGEAIPHYRYVLGFVPNDGPIRDEYARCLRLEGDVSGALHEEQQALADVGESPAWRAHILDGLALAQMNAGQNQPAESSLREATKLNPEAADAHLTLGLLLEKENRLPEAVVELSESAHLSQSAYAYMQLGIALEAEQKFSEAARAYRNALKLEPGWQPAQQQLNSLPKH